MKLITTQVIEDAKKLLDEAGGYPDKAWLVYSEFGTLGVCLGDHEQEALDNAANDNLLDGQLMSDEDYQEYESKGWNDSFMLLGNASKPFWSEYLGLEEVNV